MLIIGLENTQEYIIVGNHRDGQCNSLEHWYKPLINKRLNFRTPLCFGRKHYRLQD